MKRLLKRDNKDFFPQGDEGSLDTSFLLEELYVSYKRTGQQVEVDFRKMVDWVRLGDQLTHHLHPYPAKLLPNIAHFFVHASKLSGPCKRILDPFCGSGTVALEASLAGYAPFVADANPLALLITKVKTTSYQPEVLWQTAIDIVTRASRLKTAPIVSIVNDKLWYSSTRKKELEILLLAIQETKEDGLIDFFRVCFSVVARKFSFADPAISVPVRLREKDNFGENIKERIKNRLSWIVNADLSFEFLKVCEANIGRVKEANVTRSNRVAAIEVGVDARQLRYPEDKSQPLSDGSFPLVVTSPPYGSAQKYIRSSSLALNWLGLASPKELSSLEGKTIGREHIPLHQSVEIADSLPEKYKHFLNKVYSVNQKRAKITECYLHEMKSALTEMVRVTSKGGHIVLIIGNNLVCGEALRNDEFVTEILCDLGLTLELSLIDHIKSRGLMTKRNKTASLISRESVLIFVK